MVQRGGYDSIAAAVSGLMHITGHEVWCSTYKFNRIFVPYAKLDAAWSKLAYADTSVTHALLSPTRGLTSGNLRKG